MHIHILCIQTILLTLQKVFAVYRSRCVDLVYSYFVNCCSTINFCWKLHVSVKAVSWCGIPCGRPNSFRADIVAPLCVCVCVNKVWLNCVSIITCVCGGGVWRGGLVFNKCRLLVVDEIRSAFTRTHTHVLWSMFVPNAERLPRYSEICQFGLAASCSAQ